MGGMLEAEIQTECTAPAHAGCGNRRIKDVIFVTRSHQMWLLANFAPCHLSTFANVTLARKGWTKCARLDVYAVSSSPRAR